MANPRFLFQLQHPSLNGGVPVDIQEPIGWKRMEVTIKRHEKYHGFLTEFSQPLEFWGNTQYDGGYQTILDFYKTFGPDNEMKLIVFHECGSSYEFLYEGWIALNRASFEYKGGVCTITAPIEHHNSQNAFWNNISTKVDLLALKSVDETVALDEYDRAPYKLTMHSKSIRKTTQFKKLANFQLYTDNQLAVIPSGVGTYSLDKTIYGAPGWDTQIKQELHVFQGIANAMGEGIGTTVPAIFIAEEAGDYYFDWCFSADGFVDVYTGAELDSSELQHDYDGFDLIIYFQKNGVTIPGGSFPTYISEPSPHVGNTPGDNKHLYSTGNISFTGIIHLEVGDKIELYFSCRVYGVYEQGLVDDWPWSIVFQAIIIDPPCCFTIKLDSTFEESDIKVFAVNEAFSRIAESVTNNKIRVFSDYFGRTDAQPFSSVEEGCAAFTTLTNGLLLRGREIPTSEDDIICDEVDPGNPSCTIARNPVSMSFEELFDNMRAIWACGMTFEPTSNAPSIANPPDFIIRIEELRYFYDNTQTPILSLDKIPKYQFKVADQEIFNKIVAGFEIWESEDFNGLEEFNTPREYTTLQRFYRTETDLRCKYIGSGYTIEITRRQGADSTDYKYDNNIFVVCVKQSVAQMNLTEKDENFTALIAGAGLFDGANSYNLRIAPQRNLFRWFPVLFSSKSVNTIKQTYKEGNDREQYQETAPCCEDYSYIIENDPDPPCETAKPQWNRGELVACSLPIYQPEILEFEYMLVYSDFVALRAGLTRMIEIADSFAADGLWFIREVRYNFNDAKANFKLVRA